MRLLQGKETEMAKRENPDRYAARHIILAQAASDGGKEKKKDKRGNTRAVIKTERGACRKAWREGYSAKEEHIMCAILDIARRRGTSRIHFFVKWDEKDVAKYLVYFNFKIEGKRYQVSFHSFDDRLRRFIKAGNPHHTRWNSSMFSRDACRVLAEHVIEGGRCL